MTAFLLAYFTQIILAGGYFGIMLLMVFESMVLPVPSEAVLPFAGFLWFMGKMDFWPIVLFATAGSLIGSLISYYIGKYGGEALVGKYGRYFLLNKHHLDLTHDFFNRYGAVTIFVGRFIPVVRHLISLPAGAGKMNVFKFILLTLLGAGLWNSILTFIGYVLGKEWQTILAYGEMLDLLVLAALIGVIVYFAWKKYKRKNKK